MRVRLIATTITPIVSKSRFLRVRGAQAVVSNQPYLELQGPTRHRCRTTLVVKQGIHGMPVYRRAHTGYLHVDFKVKSWKQARRKIDKFFQVSCVGRLTAWGYGQIGWILEKWYATVEGGQSQRPRFRILKGLPPNLTPRERQVVMAALLHDLVDTNRHPSKLGRSLPIPDPYVHWLCTQHHAAHVHLNNPDLPLLQEADHQTARYARLLAIPTARRKLTAVNTRDLARQLEAAAQTSVYHLYSVIYHTQELNSLTASKAQPTESLRFHLLGVANWVLFLLRTPRAASVALAGQPGGTPGPVEVEDPRISNEP